MPRENARKFGVLGSFEIKMLNHHFQAQWTDLLKRAEGEKASYASCATAEADCSAGMKEWRRTLASVKELPRREQMTRINRSINHLVKYENDRKIFGEKDHWATPLESLKGRGDCEDYAILKFMSLLELGFDSDQLRVVIVRDRRRNLMHAVLSVRLDGTTYILDNLSDYAVEHQYVLKYVPLYSANLDAQWVHIATNKIRAAFITEVMKGGPDKAKARDERVSRASEEDIEKPQLKPNRARLDVVTFVDWT